MSNDLAPGETDIVEVYAPENELAILGGLKFRSVGVDMATSGTHSLHVGRDSHSFLHVYGKYPYNATIEFLGLKFVNLSGATTKVPTTEESMIAELKEQVFDSRNSLRLEYRNNTNATITHDREYRVYCMLRKIG